MGVRLYFEDENQFDLTDADILAQQTVDTTVLAEAVKTTFLLSMAGGVSIERRAILNALGSRMRDQLRTLLNQYFDAGTEALNEANLRIKEVNAQLEQAKRDLDGIANTIEGIGKLVASLDKLISLVGGFIL